MGKIDDDDEIARQRLRWKTVENVGNCMLQAAKLGRIVIILIRIYGRRRIWVWVQLPPTQSKAF